MKFILASLFQENVKSIQEKLRSEKIATNSFSFFIVFFFILLSVNKCHPPEEIILDAILDNFYKAFLKFPKNRGFGSSLNL